MIMMISSSCCNDSHDLMSFDDLVRLTVVRNDFSRLFHDELMTFPNLGNVPSGLSHGNEKNRVHPEPSLTFCACRCSRTERYNTVRWHSLPRFSKLSLKFLLLRISGKILWNLIANGPYYVLHLQRTTPQQGMVRGKLAAITCQLTRCAVKQKLYLAHRNST